jgi:hypothetical protein
MEERRTGNTRDEYGREQGTGNREQGAGGIGNRE